MSCPSLKFFDKKVLVLGFSKSGIYAARYLNKAGADVYITEFREEKTDDAEKLNEKINTEIEEQINVELTEYVKKQEASYKKQCEKIVKDYNKALFEYEVECKKNVQNVKNIIKKELKEEVKRKLQIFTEKEEYLQYLIKTINDSLSVVNNDNSSIIFVTNNDKQKYEEVLNRYNIKIDVLDNDFIGGCKLKNDKLGVIIDNTLKTNLDEI